MYMLDPFKINRKLDSADLGQRFRAIPQLQSLNEVDLQFEYLTILNHLINPPIIMHNNINVVCQWIRELSLILTKLHSNAS
jgi:hypothetical protein